MKLYFTLLIVVTSLLCTPISQAQRKSLPPKNPTAGQSRATGNTALENTVNQTLDGLEQTLTRAIDVGSKIPVEGYPNFQLALGVSRAYGEFARLKWCSGGLFGFTLYGGVGKDWLFNGDNKDIMSWHAAWGIYAANGGKGDFTFAFSVAETPVVEGHSFGVDLTYSHFFGNDRKIGIFGGAGFAAGNLDESYKNSNVDPTFVWDIHFGVSFKLWSK